MANRQGTHIDLRTEGGFRSVTTTPGLSARFVFSDQLARVGAGGGGKGNWNCIRGVMVTGFATIVRSAGGTTPIYGDQYPRGIKSNEWQAPMFGTLVDPTVVNGMVLKHICEYIGMGYDYQGVRRLPIPGTDATYVRAFEMYYPLAQGWNEDPEHFDYWLGWLADSTWESFVEDASNPFGVSAGVTITNIVIEAALDMVPKSELLIPPYVVTQKYDLTAGAGTTGPTLTNVGTAKSLQGPDDMSRLVAMLFSHQAGGFIGSGTADQISAIQLGWADQPNSTLPHMFFLRYLREAQQFMAGITTTGGAAVDVEDTTSPYVMPNSATATLRLNTANARFTPLRWPGRGQKITTLQKVKGNYPLDITFNATQSGQMRTYTMELKQWGKDKVSQMVAAAGVAPDAVVAVPKMADKNFDAGRLMAKPMKYFGIPRSIVPRAVTPSKKG
jgi:hypothetical protein